jgi:RNA polymerase sigma-70 factor (ECF subfamily)
MPGEELTARSSRPAERDGAADAALVAALATGDREALARLYDGHSSLLLALGLRILGDRTAAEDVLHDVFLEAWHRAADFDPDRGSVRAWLVTRMRSRALDRRAAHVRQNRLAEDAGREGGDGAAGAVETSLPIDGAKVRHQIATMPEELTTVLELAYFDGLSSSQIGLQLGIPVGTVKSRMARALSTLRERLATLAPGDRKST